MTLALLGLYFLIPDCAGCCAANAERKHSWRLRNDQIENFGDRTEVQNYVRRVTYGFTSLPWRVLHLRESQPLLCILGGLTFLPQKIRTYYQPQNRLRARENDNVARYSQGLKRL